MAYNYRYYTNDAPVGTYIGASVAVLIIFLAVMWFVRRRRNATKQTVIISGGSMAAPTQPVFIPVQQPSHVVYARHIQEGPVYTASAPPV